MNLHKLQDIVEDRGAWHAVVHGIAKIQTRRSDETTVITLEKPRNRVIFLYIKTTEGTGHNLTGYTRTSA